MCLAVPGKVIEVRGDTALVESGGARREVSILAVPGIRGGEFVLLSFGMAVERISPQEAAEIETAWAHISG